jgi:hypothetical protein
MNSTPSTAWGWPLRYKAHHISEEVLEGMRGQIDSIADEALIAANMDSNKLLEMIGNKDLRESIDSTSIRAFVNEVCDIPQWIDWDLVKYGQLVFFRHTTPALMGLLYFSLIGGFSAPKIVKVLDETKYLTAGLDRTWRRLNETLEMVFDALESPDALVIGNNGWKSVVKVRLLHSAVRLKLLAKDISRENTSMLMWDSKTYGLPINQEDMMATLLSFSVNVLESIENVGCALSERDKYAYLHLWRVIGYYIGVKEDFNPCISIHKASGALESIVLHLLHPNRRSQEVANHVLSSVTNRPPLKWTFSRHSQAARMLLGKPLADALAIQYNSFDYIYLTFLFFLIRLFSVVFAPFISLEGLYVSSCKKAMKRQLEMALDLKPTAKLR